MSGEITAHSDTPERTAAWGEAIAAVCEAGDVIALRGELGAGKTQFTRGLASGLGVDPAQVSSPTFVLVHEYEVEPGARGPAGRAAGEGPTPGPRLEPRPGAGGIERLVHIDAYRLSDAEELATVGWEGEGEELREGAVVAIEWARRVSEALGPDVLWVQLAHAPAGRSLRLRPRGAWVDKIHRLRKPAAR